VSYPRTMPRNGISGLSPILLDPAPAVPSCHSREWTVSYHAATPSTKSSNGVLLSRLMRPNNRWPLGTLEAPAREILPPTCLATGAFMDQTVVTTQDLARQEEESSGW
jgi:hypothetical protein